jgi:hypothetical protein
VSALALGWLLIVTGASAQSDERNRMGVPPSTIFKSMLRFVSVGESSKVDRSLTLLKPVLDEHEAAFGVAAVDSLLDRIKGKDAQKSEQAVRLLIARDAVLLLRSVSGASLDRARTLARTAALEWRIVEEDLAQVDVASAAAAKKISARFQELFTAVETKQLESIRTLSGRLERDILALFP